MESEETPPNYQDLAEEDLLSPSSHRDRNKTNMFTEDEEADLVEWYRDQVFLYNKEYKDHKNRDKKTRVLAKKGKTMNPPVEGMNNNCCLDYK